MTPRLFDVHTHTQFAAFSEDISAVVERALNAGIWMINVGTQNDTSQKAIEISKKYEGVFATVGLHPIHTEKSYHDEKELGASEEISGGFTSRGEDFDYDYYKGLAEDSKVVAIGECGLDYYRLTGETKEKQAEVFIRQIELANEVKKPLMIHCRNAFGDLIPILKKRTIFSSGIVHFFSGSKEDAEKLMELGFLFSFGGAITFAREYEKLIKFIPLEKILLETDAPYVTPHPYRSERNEPLYVEEVAKKISRIKNIDFDEVAAVTTQNALRVFSIKKARC